MRVSFHTGDAALLSFLNDRRGGAERRIDEGGYNASGGLKRSLRTDLVKSVGHTDGTMFAAAYWEFVGNGRGPGKAPPRDKMRQWLLDKGLATEVDADRKAYAIQRSIALHGTLDHQQGGKNLFLEEWREGYPALDPVIRFYLNDLTPPLQEQFALAFA